jgi:hypothetical protein
MTVIKMTKLHYMLLAMNLLPLLANYVHAQGCSDAGFCTINSFKPNSTDSAKAVNNQLKIGGSFGIADANILAYGAYLEYNRQLGEKFALDLKLTALAQNGNSILMFGFSDVFLNANYRPTEKLKFTLGVKMPLNKSDKMLGNMPLPMDYQSSLGTFDLVFGVGYEIKKFQLVAAVQQPLTQNNNQFIASDQPVNSELYTLHSTNKFKRSGDVLLRVAYPFALSQKFKLTPSILGIYHLMNDKYTDEFNVEKEIMDSDGLTLNINVYLDYEINNKHSLQLNISAPALVRPVRPDGLTRGFLANLEYRVKF